MKNKPRVLYVGQHFYHCWYLSRQLRRNGWKADVLNWDFNEKNRSYYHGEDFRFRYRWIGDLFYQIFFFIKAIFSYDIFHFNNAHGIKFGHFIHSLSFIFFCPYLEIRLLKFLGKKIVYSNNGCLDGVSQTSFNQWGKGKVCEICCWSNVPNVCSDKRNLKWGKIRNILADYQVTLGGNRRDYNMDPRIHEVPEFYCLDQDFWKPEIKVPDQHKLSFLEGTVKIYHAVGNFILRTDLNNNVNIKCSHIYFPLIERLKRQGYKVELVFLHDIPNKEVRYYQVQCDIVVDMLTFGWFGANVREGMMLGKPCVCFLRPEWIESVRKEIPDYIDELPVVSATPETACEVLKDLIDDPKKRKSIGLRSREFAVKWHSSKAAAKKFDSIYSELIK